MDEGPIGFRIEEEISFNIWPVRWPRLFGVIELVLRVIGPLRWSILEHWPTHAIPLTDPPHGD